MPVSSRARRKRPSGVRTKSSVRRTGPTARTPGHLCCGRYVDARKSGPRACRRRGTRADRPVPLRRRRCGRGNARRPPIERRGPRRVHCRPVASSRRPRRRFRRRTSKAIAPRGRRSGGGPFRCRFRVTMTILTLIAGTMSGAGRRKRTIVSRVDGTAMWRFSSPC